jgi:ubiquinone/menaquinone biosynthesis C-methylase UbiE
MLQQARQLQAQRNLTNVDWVRGDVTELPFRDGQFSIVTSRFVFHHLPDPALALREMVRVSKPGGRIVVADSAPAADKADAFNSMERLRDPSHVEALPVAGLSRLFTEAGLEAPRTETMRLEGDLESLLARSFPKDGDADRIRRLFEDSLVDDRLDMVVRRENGRIVYGWALAIVTAHVGDGRS